MTTMRAKMAITGIVDQYRSESDGPVIQETLVFTAVSKDGAYPSDGSDEDNTYAKFSPSGHLRLTVANPALIGKFAVGKKYYLDFTQVE